MPLEKSGWESNMIYLLLFTICIAIELSEKVNTDNIIKKIAIGLIAVGALVEYDGHNSLFIEIGILTYLTVSIFSAYFTRKHRRAHDKYETTKNM